MLRFAADAVHVANTSESIPERKFGSMWNKPDFSSVQKQYERMLQHLPEAQAQQWKDAVGISNAKDEDAVMKEADHTSKDEGEKASDEEPNKTKPFPGKEDEELTNSP